MSNGKSDHDTKEFGDYEGEFAKETQKRKRNLILAAIGLLSFTGAILYVVLGHFGTMSTKVRQLGKDQIISEGINDVEDVASPEGAPSDNSLEIETREDLPSSEESNNQP